MKLNIGAILAGYAVSFFISLIQMAVPFIYVAIEQASASNAEKYSILSFFSITIGLIASFVGGYVAAMVAKREEVLHGVVLSLLSSFIGLAISFAMMQYFDGPQTMGLANLGPLLLSLIGSIGGALLRKRKNDQLKAEAESPLEKNIENLGNQ